MANQEEFKPDYLSPDWHDYVMTLFTDKELVDGNPNVAGLRRVAELLIGEIVHSCPQHVYPPSQNDELSRSTVVYLVKFQTPKGIKEFADIADCWSGNTDDMFLVHSPATASTRAEARALRKALKIRGVAAEELCKKDVSKTIAKTSPDNDRINQDQIKLINIQCKKLDIEVMKFINSGSKKYKSIYEVKKSTAINMISDLNVYYNNQDSIPDHIKGYSETWREE